MTGADPAGQMTKAFECLPLSCRNGCRLHCPAHAIASSLRTRNKWATMKRPRVYWREAGLLRLPPKRSSSAQDDTYIISHCIYIAYSFIMSYTKYAQPPRISGLREKSARNLHRTHRSRQSKHGVRDRKIGT